MGVLTGDLSPRGSGTASLGVEQVNGIGGFTNDIRPYAHVHHMSGVLHNLGYSGVLRLGFDLLGNPIFECSTDGGIVFGDLPHSGQIQEAINAALSVVSDPVSLDDAYEVGATISVDLDNPVVVHEPGGGLPVLPDLAQLEQIEQGLIVASGYSLAPENPDTYALTSIYPGFIYLKSSGVSSDPDDDARAHVASFGYLRDGSDPSLFTVATSGGMLWSMQDDVTLFTQTGNFLINTVTANQVIRLIGRDDIQLEAFGNTLVGSGRLGYRFGPYQAWHVRQTHNNPTGGPNGDGFFPMPHSGQILQMILENGGGGGGVGTLQEAYEGNPHIFTAAGQEGAVKIFGNGTNALSLGVREPGDDPHIHFSGIIGLPANITERGHFWLQNHAAPVASQLNGASEPTTQAEADALSLGPALPMYNAGSGVTNLAISSGIGGFISATGVPFDQDNPARLDGNFDIFPVFQEDKFLTRVAESGVRFNVAGSYRISYVGVVEKTDGNYRQQVTVAPRVRLSLGREDRILGADNAVTIRSSSNTQFGTVNGLVLADFEVGETIYLKYTANTTPLPDFDKVSVFANGNIMFIEYLGPKRFGKFNRQRLINP